MAYKAFVVGVNTLGLKYCTRDAKRIRESLAKIGYENFFTGIDKTDNIPHLILHPVELGRGLSAAGHQLFGGHLFLGQKIFPVADLAHGDGRLQHDPFQLPLVIFNVLGEVDLLVAV